MFYKKAKSVSTFLIVPLVCLFQIACGSKKEEKTETSSDLNPIVENFPQEPSDPLLSEKQKEKLRQRIRKENQQLLKEIGNKTPPNKTIEVKYGFSQFCKKPDHYPSGKAHYRIKKNGNEIQISMVVNFFTNPGTIPPDREKEIFADVKSCPLSIQDVWKRYGITLALTFLENAKDPQKSDHIMEIQDQAGRSSIFTLYPKGYTKEEICLVLLHETAHLLGLVDEYKDDNCPDRPYISPELYPMSVMNQTFAGFENIEFFPRHIRAIFEPLLDSSHLGNAKNEADLIQIFKGSHWTHPNSSETIRFHDSKLAILKSENGTTSNPWIDLVVEDSSYGLAHSFSDSSTPQKFGLSIMKINGGGEFKYQLHHFNPHYRLFW